MLSVPSFTASAQAILNGGGGGGGGTVTNPITNELVVFASTATSPFALESAATTATLHQPLVLTNPTASTPSFTIVDTSATNAPQVKIVNAATAPTLGCSLGLNAQNNGSALYFNGDISSGTGYNPAAYRWGLVESNGTSLATSNLYIEYANGSTFTMAQSWTSSLIHMTLPLTVTGTVTASSTLAGTGVTLTSAATNPGGASTIWWTTPSTRPNFGTSGALALLSDVTAGPVVTSTTVSMNSPTSSPWNVLPTGASMTLSKLTIGTFAVVYVQLSGMISTATEGSTTAIIYAAGTIPAGYVPAVNKNLPIPSMQQFSDFPSEILIGTDGSIRVNTILNPVSTPVGASIPWSSATAVANAGIENCDFSYVVST